MTTAGITFGVQVGLESKRQLLETAKRVEALGFDSLTVADHPGSSASPFPVLAAAAAVTERLRLGPYVANAGLRRPLDLAVDTATLDVVSDGRAFLGLGAGHSPSEWSTQGMVRPDGRGRIQQLIETAEAVQALLDGERVTTNTAFVSLVDAYLEQPQPLQDRVPMWIGGNNTELLRYAGANADVVAFSGLGKTLPDGHRHEVKWRPDQIDHSVGIVEQAGAERAAPPVRQALVQVVTVTDHRKREAASIASRIGAPTDVVLDSPYLLIGTIEELVDQLVANRERWGFTSYVVRAPAIDAIAEVIDRIGA
ncbi:MAG: TIGR03621 family F420-dependent LLM class oxidoreductase [Acidimicrobiales bacterium]